MEDRLHKILAAAGVASRREAERMIAEGRVAVDGEIVTEMGVKLDPQEHRITVDGRPLPTPPRKVYVILNKPKGYVTTCADPHAPHTVMELVREVSEPLHPVGRLDKDTEGALLLTNDGELTQLLTHPRHGVQKLYQARVEGVPDEEALERLRKGVYLEDGKTAPAQVRLLAARAGTALVEIVLHEGRKRQVRRMLEAVGHPVESLERLAVGPVTIRKIPRGGWRFLSQKELAALRRAAEGGSAEAPRPPLRPKRPGSPARGPRKATRT